MTQEELGRGLVTASMISQIEMNRTAPSTELLQQLADRLGVDMGYFTDEAAEHSEQTQTYRRAQSLLDIHHYADALPLLEELILVNDLPFRRESLYQDLATCYVQLNMLPEAMDMYERIAGLALAKEDVATAVHAYYQAGRIQRSRQQLEEARMYWQRAQVLLEQHPEINMPVSLKIALNLGKVCLHLGFYPLAETSYIRALTLAEQYRSEGDFANIHHGLATVYAMTERYELARVETLAALREYEVQDNQRGVLQCRINLAVILRHQQQYADAISMLTELLETRQQDASKPVAVLIERARCWLAMEEVEKAIEDATLAADWERGNVGLQHSIHDILAAALLRNHQPSDAADHARSAAEAAKSAGDLRAVLDLCHLETTARYTDANATAFFEAATAFADVVEEMMFALLPEK